MKHRGGWIWLPSRNGSLRRAVLVLLLLLQFSLVWNVAEAVCVPKTGCDVAYAYYKARANETLDSIGAKFQTTAGEILAVNPTVRNFIATDQPLYIPFTCECLQNELHHAFSYQVQRADDIESISTTVYEDLTQGKWIGTWNALAEPNFILTGADLKIPVKCFCGDPSVSLSYGLFLTYVVVASANLTRLASDFNTTEALLRNYNPSVNWNDSNTEQYAFIPVKADADGITTAGVLAGVGIGIGGALTFLSLLALCRRCLNMEQQRRQQRRQQRMHIESKLKSLEVSPTSKADIQLW